MAKGVLDAEPVRKFLRGVLLEYGWYARGRLGYRLAAWYLAIEQKDDMRDDENQLLSLRSSLASGRLRDSGVLATSTRLLLTYTCPTRIPEGSKSVDVQSNIAVA